MKAAVSLEESDRTVPFEIEGAQVAAAVNVPTPDSALVDIPDIQESLRTRLQQLQKQFPGVEPQRKLRLAEAFLDMQRTESAQQLMNEIETTQGAPAPRLKIVRG